MTERDRILDQLKRAFNGGAWHGPSVEEVLEGVTAPMALARPVSGAHSIWEIVAHISVWEDVARRRLLDETANPAPAEDWPTAAGQTPAAWERTLQILRAGHKGLLEVAARIPDADLDSPPRGSRTTRYVLLHGAIQHDLYHAGQIAILKKG